MKSTHVIHVIMGNEYQVDACQVDAKYLQVVFEWRGITSIRVVSDVVKNPVIIGFHQVRDADFGHEVRRGCTVFHQRENAQRASRP